MGIRAEFTAVAAALIAVACDNPIVSPRIVDGVALSQAVGAYRSCDPAAPFHGPSANLQHTSLVGDKDGFGLGLPEGGTQEGTFNAATATDPFFTDVWTTPQDFTYQHTFALPSRERMVSAELELFTLGVQDGDNQVVGSDTDIRLYVDGIEIQGAFDTVDQFFFNGTAWVSQAGTITLRLPNCVLPALEDGAATVHVEILQLGTVSSFDAVGFDYSELRIGMRVPGPP